MRLGVVWFAFAGACSYAPPTNGPGDGALDGAIDGRSDAPVDAPIDAPERTGSPIALWRFDETAGTTANDAIAGTPITLTLKAGSTVVQSAGGLTFTARSAAISAPTPHTNRDVRDSGAVTVEAWVTPANTTQGATTYAVVAAASVSIMARNFGIEQRGAVWVGRARTTATTINGDPPIVATTPVDTSAPTHLVLVADGTTRLLYVNGVPFQSTPLGGGAMVGFGGWDPNYKVRVGDEDGANRGWLGTIWLLAIYDVALTQADVMQNFSAGHDCAGC